MTAKTATRKVRKPLTDAEKAQRAAARQAKVDALTAAAEAFELDEEDTRMMRAFDSLTTHYSEGNALLILAQAAQLGLTVRGLADVGGYGAFQDAGRQVRKGEHQIIFIWAPAGTSADADKTVEPEKPDHNGEVNSARRFFKVVGIFHTSQTDKR